MFDFDKLYNLTLEQYKSTTEKCYICHDPIDKKELILTCNHEYHFQCFKKVKNNKFCPYCGRPANIKKLENIENNKCLHKLKNGLVCGRTKCHYHKNKEEISNKEINICSTILKSGPKKGQQCGRNNCKYHSIDL